VLLPGNRDARVGMWTWVFVAAVQCPGYCCWSPFPFYLALCWVVQFLILSPGGDVIVPLFGNLFKDEPLPKDGYVGSGHCVGQWAHT
jgi:hypothetical protein